MLLTGIIMFLCCRWRTQMLRSRNWINVTFQSLNGFQLFLSAKKTRLNLKWDAEEAQTNREKFVQFWTSTFCFKCKPCERWQNNWWGFIYSKNCLEQARKARRCDSYLQIWNYQWLTHWLTGVGARRYYRTKNIFTNIPLRPVVLFLIWGIENHFKWN